MMNTEALRLVKATIENLAQELGYDSLKDVDAQTPLFGASEGIDSLSLVRLVAEIEREAEERFGRRVVLADERAMSRRSSPFRSVGTLSELLEERLGEGAGEGGIH